MLPKAKKILLKFRRTAFGALTLFTLRDVLYFSIDEISFHLNFSPAGTKEFLCTCCCT